jgi:hypothetical protein
MLLSFVLLCTGCAFIEKLFDDSVDNRVITPIVGLVLTALVCARVAHASHGMQQSPLHVVHILLYIACLLYVRAMLDFFFRNYFFGILDVSRFGTV